MSEWKNALGPSRGDDTVWVKTDYGEALINKEHADNPAWDVPSDTEPKWNPDKFIEDCGVRLGLASGDYDALVQESADPVNKPAHYTVNGVEAIEVIEAIAEQYAVGEYHIGSCLKYLYRAPHKGRELQDLKKARWFLDRAIKRIEKNERET